MTLSGGKNSAGDSKSSGGPLPAGNGGKPVNSCGQCGAMYTGSSHTCH